MSGNQLSRVRRRKVPICTLAHFWGANTPSVTPCSATGVTVGAQISECLTISSHEQEELAQHPTRQQSTHCGRTEGKGRGGHLGG